MQQFILDVETSWAASIFLVFTAYKKWLSPQATSIGVSAKMHSYEVKTLQDKTFLNNVEPWWGDLEHIFQTKKS